MTIVAYKEHARLDPGRARSPAASSRTAAPRLTGSAYRGCITPRLTRPGPPAYRYYDWTPAPTAASAVAVRGQWRQSGTPVPGIIGYELDQQAGSSSRVIRVGGGSARCQSGLTAEPGGPGPGPGGAKADTTLRRLRSGALVFTTGTLGWELGLSPVPSASPDAPRAPDPRVVRMTRNLLEHVLRQR